MSSRVIWRYPLRIGENEISTEYHSEVLSVQVSRGKPQCWMMIYKNEPSNKKTFVTIKLAGESLDDNIGWYKETFIDTDGFHVGHVFVRQEV